MDGDNEVDQDDQDLVDAAEIAGSTCADPTPLSSGEFARADANADCVIDEKDQAVVNDALGFEPDLARYEYAWGAENRLISVTPAALPVNPVMGATYFKVSYKYDYLGRRFERTVSDYNYMTDAWDLVHERRRFVWGSAPAGSEWLMLREIIDTDTTSPPDGSFDENRTRNYAWGRDLAGHGGGSSGSASCGTGLAPVSCLTAAGGIGGLLAVHDDVGSSTDVDYVYTYDANGNVGQVVDYAAGSASASMVAKYVYEAYGSTVGKAGSYADVNTFGFSTKYWDDPAGLGYWGYRYYDAGLGRWINRDMLGECGGVNINALVANNPTGSVDLMGLFTLQDAVAPQSPEKSDPCDSLAVSVNVKNCGKWGDGTDIAASIKAGVENVCRALCKERRQIEQLSQEQKASLQKCIDKTVAISGFPIDDYKGMIDKVYDSACNKSRSFECTQKGCCGRGKPGEGPTMCTSSGLLGGFEGQPIYVCTNHLKHRRELAVTADMLHELLRWWVDNDEIASKHNVKTRNIDRYRGMRSRLSTCLVELECGK